MKKFLDLLLSFIYPNKCISCGAIIDEGLNFCDYCISKLHRTEMDNFCTVCGNPKDKCKCKYAVYRFKASVAPFLNKDSAKAALYAYKFAAKFRNLGFFADQMANCAKEFYNEIEFDYICYVPTSYKSIYKYGFDHNKSLAKEISKRLNVPVSNALKCRLFRRSQHNSNYEQRKKNVIGKYYSKCDLSGANILLIDDIKTTGSSLDECTKELLFSSAENVYCLTALIS